MSLEVQAFNPMPYVFAFLQNPESIEVEKIERAVTLAGVFTVIGAQHQDFLKRIPLELKHELALISNVLCEIQQNLRKRIDTYNPINFPHTEKAIHQFCPRHVAPNIFYDYIRPVSYEIYSLPQFENNIKLLGEERCTALFRKHNALSNLLMKRIKAREEGKEVDFLTDESRVNIAKQLLIRGVFFLKDTGQLITWFDIFYQWCSYSEERTWVLEGLQNDSAVQLPSKARVELPDHYRENLDKSFSDYVKHCTLKSVEEHLGFEFSHLTRIQLLDWTKYEHFRLTLSVYMHNPNEFDFPYACDEIAFRMCAFELFFAIKERFAPPAEGLPNLIEALIYRKRKYDETDQGRDFLEKIRTGNLDDLKNKFSGIWEQFLHLKALCETDSRDTDLDWPLLRFFMERNIEFDALTKMVSLVRRWCKEGVFLSKQSLLGFLEKNEKLTSLNVRALEYAYEDFCVEGLKEVKRLFIPFLIDPPVVISQFSVVMFNAKDNISVFIESTKGFDLECNEKYVFCLRYFILGGHKNILDILEWREDVGVEKITSDILAEYLLTSSAGLVGGLEQEERDFALAFVDTYLSRYPMLTSAQRLCLYRDIIVLYSRGLQSTIREIHSSIEILWDLCPHVPKEIICFLFSYCPNNLREDLGGFQRVVKSDLARQELLDSQKVLVFRGWVRDLVPKITENCRDDKLKVKIEDQLIQMLSQIFLAPYKFLREMFRISGISVDEGIRWGAVAAINNEGKCWSLMEESSQFIYMNWMFGKSSPFFIISFYDTDSGLIRSSYIPFLNYTDYEGDKGEGAALEQISGYTEFIREVQEEGKIKEEVIEGAVFFFKRLDALFQKLYLGFYEPGDDLSDEEVAAEGSVYLNDQVLTLLPRQWNLPCQNKECFQVEIAEESIPEIQAAFRRPLEQSVLGIKNEVMYASEPVVFDIYCEVNRLKDFSREIPEFEEADDLEPPIYSVTLYCLCEDEKIGCSMQYEEDVLNDKSVFEGRLRAHLFTLKANIYRSQIGILPLIEEPGEDDFDLP